MADRAGLLNRCRDLNPYREFESHPLRDLNEFLRTLKRPFFLSLSAAQRFAVFSKKLKPHGYSIDRHTGILFLDEAKADPAYSRGVAKAMGLE